MSHDPIAYHVDSELLITDIPRECIEDCTVPGQSADASVAYWRAHLGFTVDRARAIDCLAGYGAWERDDLDSRTDDDLAEIVLWIACGDFAEHIYECDNASVDPFDPDLDLQTNCGSSVFVLE